MVQALGGALAGVASAFSGQSRREIRERPQVQSALPVLATTDKARQINKIRSEAREERLFNLLSQPEVLGYLMAIGGLVASNQIPFSSDDDKNAYLQAVASTMSVAMGMGYAGVGDLTSLSVGILAGGASLFGNVFESLNDASNAGTNLDRIAQLLNPMWMFQNLFT